MVAKAANAKERLEQEALALPKKYRKAIAKSLLHSLEEPLEENLTEEEFNRFWGEEAEKRMKAIEEGKMTTVTWAEIWKKTQQRHSI